MTLIRPRSEWGAKPPKATTPFHLPAAELWLHHLAAEWHGPSGMRSAQRFHQDTRGWRDIAYTFCVDDDGTVYEGTGPNVVGTHTGGRNSRAMAICAMGDFTLRRPTSAMLQAIVDLTVHGHHEGWWGPGLTGGHRDAPGANTACPGGFLWDAIPDLNLAIAAQLDHTEDFTMDADAKAAFAALEDKVDKALDALAGWQPGRKDRSLVGRIGDHLKVKR